MKTIILILLIYSAPIFAESNFKPRVYQCHKPDGFQRRLELRYEIAERPLPCRVIVYRGDGEGASKELLLMHAQHQSGKCEATEQTYLLKMKNLNAICEEVTENSQAPSPVAEPAAVPAVAVAEVTPVDEPEEDFKTPKSSLPPESEKEYSWKGFYAGVVVGGQNGRSNYKTGSLGFNANDDEWGESAAGLHGGAEIGVNVHINKIVFGPELEWGYLGMENDVAQPNSPGLDTIGQTSSDFYTAIRGRLGMDFHRHLLFATFGMMSVNREIRVVDNCDVAPCGGTTVDARHKSMEWGYTFGAGYEHLLENRWSFKLEYLYFNLGERKFSGVTDLGTTYEWTNEAAGQIVRGGLNYHF